MLQGSKTMTQSAGHRAEERHAAGQQKNTPYRVLVRYNNVITWFQVLFLTARYIERDCTTAGPQDRKTAGPQDPALLTSRRVPFPKYFLNIFKSNIPGFQKY